MSQNPTKAAPTRDGGLARSLFREIRTVIGENGWLQLLGTGILGAGLAAALFTTVARSKSEAAITGALVALTGITALLTLGVRVVEAPVRGLSWVLTVWVATILVGVALVIVFRANLDAVSAATIGVGLASLGVLTATTYVTRRARDRFVAQSRLLSSLADGSLTDKVQDIERLGRDNSIGLQSERGQIEAVVASLRSHNPDSPGYPELVHALARMVGGRIDDLPIDLSGLDLRAGDFTGANFQNCDLSQTIFIHGTLPAARLRGANLAGANLSFADLSSADLTLANLDGAVLEGAFLVRANLSESRLIDANLRGAVLLGAKIVGTNLDNADLSEAVLDFAAIDADLSVSTGLSNAQLQRARLNTM